MNHIGLTREGSETSSSPAGLVRHDEVVCQIGSPGRTLQSATVAAGRIPSDDITDDAIKHYSPDSATGSLCRVVRDNVVLYHCGIVEGAGDAAPHDSFVLLNHVMTYLGQSLLLVDSPAVQADFVLEDKVVLDQWRGVTTVDGDPSSRAVFSASLFNSDCVIADGIADDCGRGVGETNTSAKAIPGGILCDEVVFYGR